MVDFRVVPEALRGNVKELDEVAGAWSGAKDKLQYVWMADDALGLLGGNAPARHNAAVTEIVKRLGEGYTALHNAAESLKAVAELYGAKDEAYYKKFGYLNEEVPR
jgi:uncharacterized protein YukE